jgi:glycosyltransferase involved in cell wall biosynthesis
VRILHVVPTYLPATRYGGPIYSVHSLCTALVRQGHDVEVLTTNVDGTDVSSVPLGTPVDLDGVKVTYFATGLGRRIYRSTDMSAALLRRMLDFDVAHLHSVFLWPTTVAASNARRAGVPYVLSPRGMLVADLIRRKSRFAKAAWISLFERRNVAGAAAVHVTSNVEGEELRRLGLEARCLAVIANGLDLPTNPDFGLPLRGIDAGRPTVLCLGRISWKKGIDRLIKAMALVPDARLVIAGNDEEGYLPRLEQLARQHGVAGRTEFTGPVYGQAKWDLMTSADVFALPSHSENFGNAVLEAMA